jgi:predicted nucleic acid-binding protein
VDYFDTSYVAKCYCNEPDSPAVRKLVATAGSRGTSAWTVLELACTLHRHLREGRLTKAQLGALSEMFHEDIASGAWTLLPLSPALIDRARRRVEAAPKGVFLRAGDAIQLEAALAGGATTVWTGDRHLRAAAVHFGIDARSV